MNRRTWILSSIVFGAFIVAGVGALFFSKFEPLFANGVEDRLTRQLAQIASPPASTTEEKPTAAAAQQVPPSTPPAPQKAPTAAAGPGWAVNCKSDAKDAGLECRMSQTVVLKQSGQVLTNVTFRVPADTKKPEVIVRLPLGLYLPAGASYQIDDGVAQRLNFRACDRNGCYANSPITAEALASLRKGKQLIIGFQNLAEKPIAIPLSLEGFADAYDKMQKPS